MGVVRPAEAMPADTFYRNGEGDEMLFVHEGTGLLDTVFGPLRYHPGDYLVLPIGTTWRLDPDDGVRPADALPRVPVGARAAEALPQRLRPAPRALAVLQRDIRIPTTSAPRTEEGDFRILVRSRGRLTGLPLRHHPFDVVGWDGYLWPYALRHRGLPADHGPRPPAAAGPPDVPGAQLRGLLVRAPQVRLPPARDPRAVQPLEHQQRRGHLLRGRQLHEPARRGDLVVHASTRPASRTGRIRARSRRRSARRRPRSWRSWSTRSTRCG